MIFFKNIHLCVTCSENTEIMTSSTKALVLSLLIVLSASKKVFSREEKTEIIL